MDHVATLRKPSHSTCITADMRADLERWIQFLDQLNGTMPMVDHRPLVSVATDAYNTTAGSFFVKDSGSTPMAAVLARCRQSPHKL